MLITPHTWSQYKGKIPISTYTQIPLMLRYAITVHRSQGMTLYKTLIECNWFECGQGYCALSRTRKLEDIYLKNLDISKIKADPLVVDFYKKHDII